MTVRSFGKKKGKGGGGGGGGGGQGRGNKFLKVYEVWSGQEEDVKDTFREEDPIEVRVGGKDTMKQLRSVLDLDEDDDINIYNSKTKEFENLVDMEQVNREANANQGKIALAPADDFPEGMEDYDEDFSEDEDFDFANDEPDGMEAIHESRVSMLVESLKEEGWERAAGQPGMLTKKDSPDSQTQTTQSVILQLASIDMPLREYLLGHVGALNHLVTCTDFDFVWEDMPEVDGEADDEDEDEDDDDDDDDDMHEAEFKEKDA
eukprot:CAMPEP_0113465810 /NCGR_PEP_ID=MMETSP0014_2-20120614/13941_1 /TAXON_ID=2857 /ORGANISM="Nitzschia sp." /LENGTH=261 /DNA_ID=CAMNT_0000357999 /DNA_START=320 /DNA_END=1105 /DNA_ORIENTATION=- /assembly_acc=CAM_ASM_000159